MSAKSALLMRVLINRFHKGSPDTLARYLPESEADAILKQEIDATEVAPLLEPAHEKIGHIHYSWIVPTVQNLPKKIKPILFAALPEEQGKHLAQLTGISPSQKPLAPVLKHFIVNLFLKHLEGAQEVLPLAYLPSTPLSALASVDKTKLIELIGYLGIHDLAVEIRHVVDNKKLKGVYACLNAKEQQYLRACMHLKEKYTVPSLGLEKWGGDCAKLRATLQARGLMRLGKALSGEHPDLIWHITHILDTGRGQALSKSYAEKPFRGLTPALAQQTVNLLGILKKKTA